MFRYFPLLLTVFLTTHIVKSDSLEQTITNVPQSPDRTAYFGVSIFSGTYEEKATGISTDISLKGFSAFFYKEIIEYIGVEFNTMVSSGEKSFDGIGKLKITASNFTLYAKLKLPYKSYSPNVSYSPYIIAGPSFTQVDGFINNSFTDKNTFLGLSYGIGLDLKINKKITFSVRYSSLLDEKSGGETQTITGINLSLYGQF